MQIPATLRFDSRQMTDNNSSRPKYDDLDTENNQSQIPDYLPVRDADYIANTAVVSAGLRIGGIRGSAELTGDNRNNVLRGTADADVLRGLGGNDRLFGGGGDDTLIGGGNRDRLEGQGGDDQLFGNSGRDTLIGGDGQDSLEGNSGDDRLNGNKSADTLIGDTGNDTLIGGSGRDVLIGGLGQDTLDGAAGRDRIVYNSFDDRGDVDEDNLFDERGDEIVDFDTDEDVIDLRKLFTGSNYSASDRFDEYVILANDDDENTFIRVDIDGNSGDKPFRTLATVTDVDFDDLGGGNFLV